MLRDSIRKLNSAIINFDQNEFSSTILNCFLTDYIEEGGNECAFKCINDDGEMIHFETADLFKNINIAEIIQALSKLHVNEFHLKIDEIEVVGYSEYNSKEWIIGTGDKISIIREAIEPVWYSLFEQ